jgi:hypothetical protein
MPWHWGGVEFIRTLHTVLDFFMPELVGQASIYPNQLGNFKRCADLRVARDVPEQLMVALRELSGLEHSGYRHTENDLRERLVDVRLNINRQWESITLASVCRDVDSCISRLYADRSHHADRTFRQWVVYVNRTWFESRKPEGPRLFTNFAANRALIVVHVIFDKETRDLISEFAALSTSEISMLIGQIRQFKSLQPEVDKLRATLSDLQKQAGLIPKQRAG